MIAEIAATLNLTTVLVFSVIALLTWMYAKTIGLPPGPWLSLPFIGYTPFLLRMGEMHLAFCKLAKKYGNIMSMRFGSNLVVIFNDFESIKEAYVIQGDTFAGRPQDMSFKFQEDDTGLFINEGDLWKEHRRFTLSTFRDFGMGKNSIEPRIMDEIHCMLKEIAKHNGQPYEFSQLLAKSMANVISSLEYGRRFEYDEPDFIEMMRMTEEVGKLIFIAPARRFIPWISKYEIFESLTKQKEIMAIVEKSLDFTLRKIDEHEENYVEGSSRDYIDAYLTERKAIIKKTGSEGYFTYKELCATLGGLFGAATDTTASTIKWAMFATLIYPEMQNKIHQEIETVIGLERVPTMADRAHMPYTDAFLLEVQRFGTVSPLSVFRRSLEETTVLGYRIPKHTVTISNAWAVHFDPKLWNEPEVFKPERFINDKGQVVKPEYLIPFGIGKRICLGESLARMEVFLYFTSMLQRFRYTTPQGVRLSFDDHETSFSRRPKPFKFIASQKKDYHVSYTL